ncbi:olfactory receptor 52I2-like [Thunnus maccoyii]|uniref:olfactory receptor 52I2-like n=1 Tax=Thunnus maccoyii TaxID=8240 RepID=UPI001C4B7F70|nr:olfactory receptor 52I2-like [Thunnus maccoyii]
MSLQNASIKVTEFIIGGFDKTKKPFVVGVVILITYVLAILANMMNILFIINDKRLHKPMYLLICNLAVVDILYTSSSSPTMIGVLVAGVNTISYVPCFIEMFAFHLKYSFCEYAAVMRTTCVDPTPYFNLVTIIMFFLIFFTFAFICLSYILIIFFVQLSSNNNKRKMGSTCLSHLVVVTCYYCPRMDREVLLGATVTPDGLFGFFSSVTQCFNRLKEEKAQLSHHLPLAPSSNQRGNNMRHRNVTARRRVRRQARAPAASTASATSNTTSTESLQPRPMLQ